MRHLNVLFVFLAFSSSLRAEDKPAPKKESVSFDGVTLFLASEEKDSTQSLKEYLPEGQKFESWTKLAAIREYTKLDNPKAIATNMVRALKEKNPLASSALIQNPKTGEVIVDFVTWPPDNSFVEFNVFKYSKKAGGGLVAQQYALREYKDTEAFLKALKRVRLRLVDLMAKDGLVKGD